MTSTNADGPGLVRRLGLAGAIVIGLSSMIGAGVFVALAPAAESAGSGLLIGLVIAAVVAACNATSSAQLAAVYPQSGGTYAYGRARLGPWWGFLAGWSFVIGKTASCAAMAMAFAAYVAPEGWERPVAVAAVVCIAFVNYHGVTRTAQLAAVIVVIVLAVLVLVVSAGASAGLPRLEWSTTEAFEHGWYGILQAAGILFFAFAGYARIATLGEEVKNPSHTIPRAIALSLGTVVLVYLMVAIATLGALGSGGLALSGAPLIATVQAVEWRWATPLVQIGGALASLGALLALMTGIGRTSLAMAREADLPRWLAAVHPRYRVPHRAEIVLATVVIVVVLTVDLRGAIGFSSFGVLLYYFVANLSAFTQPNEQRRYPRGLQVFGGLACIALVATLPASSVIVGIAVLLAGAVLRVGARRVSGRVGPRVSRRRRSSS